MKTHQNLFGYGHQLLLQLLLRIKQAVIGLFRGSKVIQKVVQVDYSTPFDPVTFIGKGWSVVRCGVGFPVVELDMLSFENVLYSREMLGELERECYILNQCRPRFDPGKLQAFWEENQSLIPGWKPITQDVLALAAPEVTSESMLRSGEVFTSWRMRDHLLRSLKHIRLNALVFRTLWENQSLIPESWKSGALIAFEGTVLSSPSSRFYVLCLFWRDNGWHWDCVPLGFEEGVWSVCLER